MDSVTCLYSSITLNLFGSDLLSSVMEVIANASIAWMQNRSERREIQRLGLALSYQDQVEECELRSWRGLQTDFAVQSSHTTQPLQV